MLNIHSTFQTFKANATYLLVMATESHFKKQVPQKVLAGKHWDILESELKTISSGPKGKVLKTFTNDSEIKQIAIAVLPNSVSRGNSPTRKSWIYQFSEELEGETPPAVMVVVDSRDHAEAVVGALSRRLRLYNRQSKNGKKREIQLLVVDDEGHVIESNSRLESLGASVAWTCRICDTAPSDMNPKIFSEEIKTLFKNHPEVSLQEMQGSALLESGLNGVHGVGRAATEEPRVVIVVYEPKAGAKAQKTIALIGKGVTYDTGGLSLKVQGSMVGMKMDLGGAAAVIGAFQTLVQSGFEHRLIACVGLVENAIGPTAMKPDDIIQMHSGKTVEINNTDAEGRLVLADCASYIGRQYHPEIIIDAATLTGAQMVATGLQHAAIVTNDDLVEELAIKAGKASGDLVAPLPFAPEFFEDEFKSLVADMKNSVKNRTNAQPSCAGQFIYSHIEDLNVKWLHIDLAGPASTLNGLGTGYGVGLMSQFVRMWVGDQ